MMSLRRLALEQPTEFAFTPANLAWAEAQMTKYPEGRHASAVLALLWRAQEQEGWLTRAAIEYVADLLGMAYIRVLEVAAFYFLFQLHPTGSIAHIQVCGTTSCMICGAEDLIAVCKRRIAEAPQTLSADGKFTWEEVECIGACANAPAVLIGKDYYEDLTVARFEELLDQLAAGEVPLPGPQNGRYGAEPITGLTALQEYESGRTQYNASVQAAADLGDTIKRIDGTEVPLLVSWQQDGTTATADMAPPPPPPSAPRPTPARANPPPAAPAAKPAAVAAAPESAAEEEVEGVKPAGLDAPRDGKGDDLKTIEGIGPVLEKLCHSLGIYHFDQIAAWGPAEVAWMDGNLKGFRGRITRDKWVAQAKLIGEVGIAEFLERAKTNDY